MHLLHGHLIADILVFGFIVIWQRDIDKIHPAGLLPSQELEEPDLHHTNWTTAVVQHLEQSRRTDENSSVQRIRGRFSNFMSLLVNTTGIFPSLGLLK